MPRPKFSVSDAGSNGGYNEVPGLIELTWTQSGNSYPGTIEAIAAVDEVLDGASWTKRFYPFLHFKLEFVEWENGLPDFTVIIGRLDTANQQEDDEHGRVWKLVGRDYLAVLVDNFVDKGPGGYVPNYVGDQGSGSSGARRADIISDLATKIVTTPANEVIASVQLDTAPNSKPIEVNLDNESNTSILDAIRQLAAADPWDAGGGGEVDGKDLADAGFPDGSGFGAEFQIVELGIFSPGGGSSAGRVASYYKRGSFDSGVTLRYGDQSAGSDAPLVGYNFDKEGADLYSRVRTAGKGEATYRPDGGGGNGTGVVVSSMEDTWSPENGQFNVRREYPVRFEGDVGDWFEEVSQDDNQSIRARGLHDRAFGFIFGGAAGLNNTRGPSRGQVTIGGPACFAGQPLPVGYMIKIGIPQIGVDDSFVVDNYKYQWPEDQTTIEVARRSFTSAAYSLGLDKSRGQDASAGHNDAYDSYWKKVDGSGTLVLKHNLGVRAGTVKVQAALDAKLSDWASTSTPTDVPKLNTEVDVHQWTFDASQGQFAGFTVTENTPNQITLKFARWLAYSEGAGKWLKNNADDVLVRVRLGP